MCGESILFTLLHHHIPINYSKVCNSFSNMRNSEHETNACWRPFLLHVMIKFGCDPHHPLLCCVPHRLSANLSADNTGRLVATRR